MPPPHPTKSQRARLRPLAWLIAIALLPALACCEPPSGNEEFPRSALQIHAHGGPSWFNIRIADTPAHQELGLMFVTHLPSDEGMLFPQEQPRIVAMWMKNTLIPLDMLFIDTHGKIVCVIANAKPESLDVLSCDKPVKAVLEIGGGEAQRRGIQIGDTVLHAAFDSHKSKKSPAG
jgi:uncharacterized protein